MQPAILWRNQQRRRDHVADERHRHRLHGQCWNQTTAWNVPGAQQPAHQAVSASAATSPKGQTLTASSALSDVMDRPISYQWQADGATSPAANRQTPWSWPMPQVGKVITATANFIDGMVRMSRWQAGAPSQWPTSTMPPQGTFSIVGNRHARPNTHGIEHAGGRRWTGLDHLPVEGRRHQHSGRYG